jgi:hypothetical protein
MVQDDLPDLIDISKRMSPLEKEPGTNKVTRENESKVSSSSSTNSESFESDEHDDPSSDSSFISDSSGTDISDVDAGSDLGDDQLLTITQAKQCLTEMISKYEIVREKIQGRQMFLTAEQKHEYGLYVESILNMLRSVSENDEDLDVHVDWTQKEVDWDSAIIIFLNLAEKLENRFPSPKAQ